MTADLIELDEPFLGYVDGEGEWQERQTRWHLRDVSAGDRWWSFLSEEEGPGSCSYEDLEQWVDFY